MILITGGAGYIGSHCVIDFIKQGYDVVILDNLSVGHIEIIERLKNFAKNYDGEQKGSLVDFVNADIRDTYALNVLFNTYKIDCVVHFAANALISESMENPGKYYENNVLGSISLLNSMIDNNVKKIIFSSTCATYGESCYLPVDEKHPQKPVNPYGNTKLAVEFAIKDYAKAYGLKYTIFRYFNAIGADCGGITGEWHDFETHLVPNILKAKDKAFKILGDDYETPDGTCIRDYVDVSDIARAHVLACEYLKENTSTIINLGTGDGKSVKEILCAIEKTLNIKIPTENHPRREGDPAKLTAKAELAKKILNWEPQISLETSVQNANEWEKTLKTLQNNQKTTKNTQWRALL